MSTSKAVPGDQGPGDWPGAPHHAPGYLARSSALISIGVILSRVTGLLRIIVITAALGVAENKLADTYNLANMVPNIVYDLFLGGIFAAIFVPVFVELVEEHGERAAAATSALINASLVALTAATILAFIAVPWIARFYAARLEGDVASQQQAAMTFLLRLFLPQVVFYGLAALTQGLLNSRKRFAIPAYTPVLNNISATRALSKGVFV